MPIDPRDAPPGYRAAPSDGNCRCTKTFVRCAFYAGGNACRIPVEFKRPGPDGFFRAPCCEPVRGDGILAMFLKGEMPYGNEEPP